MVQQLVLGVREGLLDVLEQAGWPRIRKIPDAMSEADASSQDYHCHRFTCIEETQPSQPSRRSDASISLILINVYCSQEGTEPAFNKFGDEALHALIARADGAALYLAPCQQQWMRVYPLQQPQVLFVTLRGVTRRSDFLKPCRILSLFRRVGNN